MPNRSPRAPNGLGTTPLPGSARQKRHRVRRILGLASVRIDIDPAALTDAARRAGYVRAGKEPTPTDLADIASRILAGIERARGQGCRVGVRQVSFAKHFCLHAQIEQVVSRSLVEPATPIDHRVRGDFISTLDDSGVAQKLGCPSALTFLFRNLSPPFLFYDLSQSVCFSLQDGGFAFG